MMEATVTVYALIRWVLAIIKYAVILVGGLNALHLLSLGMGGTAGVIAFLLLFVLAWDTECAGTVAHALIVRR